MSPSVSSFSLINHASDVSLAAERRGFGPSGRPQTHVSSPASLQMFVTEVNSHRDHIIELDQTGTHLKYFSQKQDVVLIKNLLLSVQGRWEKLVQRSVERGRQLDEARKRAKQVRKQALFHCCLAFFFF